MQLLLIRHASNDWIGTRLAGWTPGVHLNDVGRAEAAALAARLAGRRLDAVYASPLERARETAGFVAAPHGITVRLLPEVGEVHFGSWEGRSLEELRAEPLWAQVQQRPSQIRFPGGESLAEVQARAVAALERLRADHPRRVVAVVSHADVIKVAVAHYAGAHLDHFQRLVVTPGSLSVIHLSDGEPRLVLFNDSGTLPPPAATDAEPGAAGAGA